MSTVVDPTTQDMASPPVRDPRRWLVLAVMSLGTLIVFLDLTVVNTALPAISFELGASTSELQWVVDSYVLALAGLLMLAGSIGDRYGRRRWMTLGLVVFGLGSIIGAVAGDISTLIAGRAVQGLGAAFVLPATLSIVTNTFERDERGKAIAIWTAVGGMGIGLGPAVGGYLVDQWGWSAAFWIHVPVIVVALIGQVVVAESRDPRRIGLDVPGAVTATLGISSLVFGIIQGAETGWGSPLILGSFAAAVAFLIAFVAIERRVDSPMLPLGYFANRDFTGSVLVIGIMFFAGPATFFFLTQFFQIVQGRDAFEAGLLILPNAGAIIVASALGPPLANRFGPKRVVTGSVMIMAVAAALFTQVNADWSALTEISVIMLFGFGFGLGMPALTDSIMASVPVEDAGIGSAVNDVSRELGSALGVAVIGSFISSIYKVNVDDRLGGQVDEGVVETAKEGIGVLAANVSSLGESGPTAVAGANQAFIDAMNSGFWLSTAVLVAGAVTAAWLLPDRLRSDQVLRTHVDEPWPTLELIDAIDAIDAGISGLEPERVRVDA
ncbi:MAG: MFS transporter [Acidimicrobiia bacterium]|nr:MFS transporter [Acidimicrobiia bacterium]